MQKIRVGVIGLGIVSERVIAQFRKNDAFQLQSVCDVSEERMSAYQGSDSNVKTYTDYRELLADSDVDLVYVATPPSFHADIVVTAFQSGKHVLCEKPLANSMSEADEMLKAATTSGRVHALHFPLQYSASMNELERLYKEGAIGTLRRLEIVMHFPQWPRPWQQNAWVGGRKQGGYTLEVGVHFIQSVQRVFGSITEVRGQMTYPENGEACEIALLATAKVLTQNESVDLLFDGLSQAGGQERVELNAYGSDGILQIHGWQTLRYGKLGEEPKIITPSVQPTSMVDNVLLAINGQPAVLADFQVGYDAQQVLEALRSGTGTADR